MVRAKMKLNAIEETNYGGPSKQTKLKFLCQYDQKLAEDVSFCKATPSGSAEFVVDNPAALEQFNAGESYYVDFTPVPKPASCSGNGGDSMTPVLTDDLLTEWEAAAAAATPAPWHFGHNPDGYDPVDYFRDAYNCCEPGRIYLTCIPVDGKDMNDQALFTSITGNGPTSKANARFIALSRTAVPALIAEIRRLRTDLAKLQGETRHAYELLATFDGEGPRE